MRPKIGTVGLATVARCDLSAITWQATHRRRTAIELWFTTADCLALR
jgi:hypothetical protein